MQGRKPRKRIFLGAEGFSERNYGRYLRLIADHDVKLLYSDPNFEAFLLRHFPGCQSKMPPADTSLSELEKVWPAYLKGIDARSIYKQLGEDGLVRACTVEDSLRDFLTSIGFGGISPDLSR